MSSKRERPEFSDFCVELMQDYETNTNFVYKRSKRDASFKKSLYSTVSEQLTMFDDFSQKSCSVSTAACSEKNELNVKNGVFKFPTFNKAPTSENTEYSSFKKIAQKQKMAANDIKWFSPRSYPATLSPFERIGKEIIEFAEFLSPTSDESFIRQSAFDRIKGSIQELWPDASVQPFGSFKSKTSMPFSHLDVAVIKVFPNNDLTEHMKIMQDQIRADLKIKFKNNFFIGGISLFILSLIFQVPILTFRDDLHVLDIEIFLNGTSHFGGSEIILEYQKNIAAIRYIIIVVKALLFKNYLKKPCKGGMGSFLIYLLLVTHIKDSGYTEENTTVSPESLGLLFFEFFELYGNRFDPDWDGISICCNNYPSRDFVMSALNPGEDLSSPLLALDPFKENSNAAKSCYNYPKIRKIFNRTFRKLEGCVTIYTRNQNAGTRKRSILESSLGLDQKFFKKLLERRAALKKAAYTVEFFG